MSESAADGTAPAGEAPPSTGRLRALAVRGSLWTMGGYAASQLLRLASNLILTRLLFPAVFGEAALVFIFIQGLAMFSDVGTGPAIIQNPKGDDPSFINTAWTIQCGRGAILWLASWAIAWPLAAFYGQPSLRWLIPAAGVTALLGGFESTAMHVLQREIKLERLTLVELAGQFAGIAATVLLAYGDTQLYGPTHPSAIWAIVGGSLVASGVRLVLSHTCLPGIRNRFRLDRRASRQLFKFGRWIFVSTLLTFLAAQLDRLIFGKMIPIALFGVYSIAVLLAALPTQAVLKLGSAVVFPAYSRLVGREDFGNLFWRVRFPALLGGAAIASGLIACGPPLVRILYDRRYVEAGWMLQYLSAAAWFQILECTNGAALLAKGHVRWVAAGSAAKVAGMIGLIPFGFHAAGFRGALVGLVLSETLKYFISSIGAAMAGLGGFARDTLVTLVVGVIAATGLIAGALASAHGVGKFLTLATSAAAVGLPWIAITLTYLHRERADSGARAARDSGHGKRISIGATEPGTPPVGPAGSDPVRSCDSRSR